MGDFYIAQANAVLELKDEAKIRLPEYLRQARSEAEHYALAHRMGERPTFFALVKARNQSIGQSFMVTTLNEWMLQWRDHG